MYETERLVESLFKENIDIRNVVVNQVLMCDIPLQKNEIRGPKNIENFCNFLIETKK